MKKIVLIMFVILALANIACANVQIDYGNSSIYSRSDIHAAVKIIKKQFQNWRGCQLHNIRYAGDAANNAENIQWLNDVAAGQGYQKNFVQCIEFLSDFYASAQAARFTTFNPNSEYKNWQWWLARTQSGTWKLLTFGY